jgi:hypothetical protein
VFGDSVSDERTNFSFNLWEIPVSVDSIGMVCLLLSVSLPLYLLAIKTTRIPRSVGLYNIQFLFWSVSADKRLLFKKIFSKNPVSENSS